MRVAAIYDLHANLPALEAVLQEINREKVDQIVVGGDVVAGPLPSETLALLRGLETPTRFVLGNAEAELLKQVAGEDPGTLSERANQEARWAAETLTPEDIQFISGWKDTVSLEIAPWGEVLFCHATPHSNTTVFTRKTPREKLRSLFENLPASLVVCGHTHMQFERELGPRRVINAGSVGMPFGRTGADWLLLDNRATFRHTDYDTLKAAERIRKSSYPHAESFAENNVLSTPPEALALEMLSKMEAAQAELK